jgi:PPOX class probable F420-dependent enzyme
VAPTFAEVAKAKYILLTTFTKDGRSKPTAIWAAPDSDRLLVIAEGDSFKVKRIRTTPASPSRCATCAVTQRARRSMPSPRCSTSPRRRMSSGPSPSATG